LQNHVQRLDELDQRLRLASQHRLDRERLKLNGLASRLRARTPVARPRQGRQQLQTLVMRLHAATQHHLQVASQRIQSLGGNLHALSPLATLNRGYAIMRRSADGVIVRRASATTVGETVEALLGEGRLHCEIKAVSTLDSAADSPLHR
jgi:exodeoxyribonuclease VII large subunit